MWLCGEPPPYKIQLILALAGGQADGPAQTKKACRPDSGEASDDYSTMNALVLSDGIKAKSM